MNGLSSIQDWWKSVYELFKGEEDKFTTVLSIGWSIWKNKNSALDWTLFSGPNPAGLWNNLHHIANVTSVCESRSNFSS